MIEFYSSYQYRYYITIHQSTLVGDRWAYACAVACLPTIQYKTCSRAHPNKHNLGLKHLSKSTGHLLCRCFSVVSSH